EERAMKHHRFSEIWPLMNGKALDDLALDIAAHGLRTPILTYQGEVLDGRSRERACEMAGVAARYEEAQVASDDEALDLAVSLNQHRRHLTKEQLAFVAARLSNLKRGRPGKLNSSNELFKSAESASLREAAEKMG